MAAPCSVPLALDGRAGDGSLPASCTLSGKNILSVAVYEHSRGSEGTAQAFSQGSIPDQRGYERAPGGRGLNC